MASSKSRMASVSLPWTAQGVAAVVQAASEVIGQLGAPLLLDQPGANLDGLIEVADGLGELALDCQGVAAVVQAASEVIGQLGAPSCSTSRVRILMASSKSRMASVSLPWSPRATPRLFRLPARSLASSVPPSCSTSRVQILMASSKSRMASVSLPWTTQGAAAVVQAASEVIGQLGARPPARPGGPRE